MRPCIFIVGTRAQLVKVAPVLQRAESRDLPHSFWLAGQHENSIDDLIKDFRLSKPLRPGVRHRERSSITGLLTWWPRAIRDCRRHIKDMARRSGRNPLVVVHGDTLSTLLGAIAARTSGADVVHMESGLTSGRLSDPFPEELIRRITFRLSRYGLCPNDAATAHMQRYRRCEAINTGENTLLDCVRYAIDAGTPDAVPAPGPYFVASIHRFENIYRRDRLARIVDELVATSEHGTVHFVLHPPTEKRLRHTGLWQRLAGAAGVDLRPRMSYTRFLALLADARGVFTDGGSNQEELSYLGVPTVLFRDRSERPDGLGRNVRFRAQIGDSLAAHVATGGLESQRQPRRLDDRLQPSAVTLDNLVRWAESA